VQGALPIREPVVKGVIAAAFASDSRSFAALSFDGRLIVRDAVKMQVMFEANIGNDSDCVAFSPSGSVLAVGSTNKTVTFLDAHTGAVLSRLTGRLGSVWSLSFAPGGRYLAVASGGEPVPTGRKNALPEKYAYGTWRRTKPCTFSSDTRSSRSAWGTTTTAAVWPRAGWMVTS
jgi:WD40 repeat protein